LERSGAYVPFLASMPTGIEVDVGDRLIAEHRLFAAAEPAIPIAGLG